MQVVETVAGKGSKLSNFFSSEVRTTNMIQTQFTKFWFIELILYCFFILVLMRGNQTRDKRSQVVGLVSGVCLIKCFVIFQFSHM